MNEAILVAIITGIFSLLVPVVYWSLDSLRERKRTVAAPAPIEEPPRTRSRPSNKRVLVGLAVLGMLIGFFIGLYIAGSDQAPQNGLPPLPTPIPRGDLIMEINFDDPVTEDCNVYDPSKLGYEKNQYYIQPEENGYIAICHKIKELAPQGSLQVDAWSEQEIQEIYGYGVLFGWKGEGVRTTDACMVGIRRKGTRTEAVFTIRQAGENKVSTAEVGAIDLDHASHTLRVTLYPDGRAYAYLDERLFGVHEFENCLPGPVGMVAWGPGDQKIYFDDLKLFALP